MPLPLLIGSNNPGKLSEIHDLLADLLPQVRWQRGESLFLPQDLGLDLDVVEDGDTYAENAARKALAFCQQSAMITLADDSGLEVVALKGAPGLHSARFAPPDLPAGQPLTSPIRRAYLLRRLAETGAPRPWAARFVCTVALALPPARPGADIALSYHVGCCPGEIIPEERGEGGFGYDPIFLLPEEGLTMAEISAARKNQLSHRALAVRAALPALRTALGL